MSISEDFRTNTLTAMADLQRRCNAGRNRPEGYKYDSMYAAVLGEGCAFSDEPLTADDESELVKVLRPYLRLSHPKVRECFSNALRLAIAAKEVGVGLKYAEGYGEHLIHTGHAWTAFRGRAIDVTWREKHDDKRWNVEAVLERIRYNIRSSAYVGVVVPLDYVRRLVVSKGYYCSVVDNFEDRWPFVRAGCAAFTEPVQGRE